MISLVLAVLVFVAAGLGIGLGWRLGRKGAAAELAESRRRSEAQLVEQRRHLDEAFQRALHLVRAERGESLQAALDNVLSVASSTFGDQLAAGKLVIERERDTVSVQVESITNELRRVSGLVTELQRERASHAEITTDLARTTRSLQQALASPTARGQWGERMAEDVLAAAGFVEGINYERHRRLAGGGVPDYSFPLPKGHVIHMDVKFPIDNYLRWLETEDDTRREAAAKAFRRDVRARVKELAGRAYIDPETTVDQLLLFVPNESVFGFVNERDPGLIDEALAQKVVLCSPTTLFAVLAIVRQAVDSFLVERRSGEILAAVGSLREQWARWEEPMEKMRRGLCSAQKAFDDLAGPRKRQFEKHLEKLEAVRDARLGGDGASGLDQVAATGAGAGTAVEPTDPDDGPTLWRAV